MRYIRYAILAVIAVCLITVALANRELVTLHLLPADLAELIGFSADVTLPLFLVILGGVIAGVLLGFIWEWMREHKHRAEATRQRREKEKLAREVSKIKTSNPGADDDVLALLENGSKAG
ncbi:lipopolysaccharide assembly LapA domain-containing protein [Pseudoruegeria sp. HB172150]|uniref:LapA family protein n=1 Tax=Pseudoruegeria sp. HB172150 TaxID=2721164 RepID=UPI0015546E1A|nr:LapA family protein [Pseudoruegeria sp. HB172150]